MKIPYSIQGFFFAPAVVGLLFFLKVTCPAETGYGCFADNFLVPIFIPLTFIYKVFDPVAHVVAHHEAWFILGYWAVVGLLVGCMADLLIAKKHTQEGDVESITTEI
jgi:hypothetical protein